MLLANGHPEAWDYPLGAVSDEAEIIVRRTNMTIATEAIAIHAAGVSIMSGEARNFNELLDRLMGA